MIKFHSAAASGVRFFVGFIFRAFTAFAAPLVATVTSAVPFVLDGHLVSSPGVTSFPLLVGDTIGTASGPAVLLFHDGSTVKLGENSSVKLDSAGAETKVVLLSGSLDFKLVAGSNVSVTNLDTVRKQGTDLPAPRAEGPRRSSVASAVSKPSFILSVGGGGVGVATAILNSFSSGTAASDAATARTSVKQIAHCPPVSVHL
jgi:hypothetical protein